MRPLHWTIGTSPTGRVFSERGKRTPVETQRHYSRWSVADALLGTSGAEEVLQEFRATRCKNPFAHFYLMVQPGMIQDFENGMNCAGFGIFRTVDETANTSVNHRARAHGAGFDGRE